ncbi:MAG: hypothetical protein J7647_22340 [Cyanobacteria bacterium SBLK]|nr:hypothetical protein [Cyanobacteria bacterium SBLK]
MKICPNCKSKNIDFITASSDPNDTSYYETRIYCHNCHYYQIHIIEDNNEYHETWYLLPNVLFVHENYHDEDGAEKNICISCANPNDAEIEHAGKCWRFEDDFLNERYFRHDTLLDTHLFLPLIKSPSQGPYSHKCSFLAVSLILGEGRDTNKKGWKVREDWHNQGFADALYINPDDDASMLQTCPVSGQRGPNNQKRSWEIAQKGDEFDDYDESDNPFEFII